jgi:hypothetical protein
MAKKRAAAKIEFDPEQVEKLAGYGLTQDQIADWFGASERTLRNRLSDDPALVAAYKKGRARALATAAGKLWDKVMQGDNASVFFYLKTQGGWSETQKMEHSGPAGGPMEVIVRRTIVRPNGGG